MFFVVSSLSVLFFFTLLFSKPCVCVCSFVYMFLPERCLARLTRSHFLLGALALHDIYRTVGLDTSCFFAVILFSLCLLFVSRFSRPSIFVSNFFFVLSLFISLTCILFACCAVLPSPTLFIPDALALHAVLPSVLTLAPAGTRVGAAVPIRHLHHPRSLHDRQNGGPVDGRRGFV